MSKRWLSALRIGERAENQNLLFLLLAWISGIVVWFAPQVGAWFVVVSLLIWLYLGVKNKSLITGNPFNIPIAVFLITALVGVWAAYQQQAAFHKFLILLAGILIYYALSNLHGEQIPQVFGLIALTAALLAIYFLLSHNWETQPADVGWINQVGFFWMKIRPELPTIFDNPNIPAGILAGMFPLLGAFIRKAQKNHDLAANWMGWTCLVLVIVAVVMSSSRAVWLLLLVGLVNWLWWEICTRGQISLKENSIRAFLWGTIVIGVASVLVLGGVISRMELPAGFFPVQASTTSRLNLYAQATNLVSDFWLTGGGLQSFAGLFSEYILNIPYLYYRYAHNLFLDITLEQGIFGIISFLSIYVVSLGALVSGLRRPDLQHSAHKEILVSLLISMLIMGGHGIVDDSYYGVQGTPFLFVIPGLVMGFDRRFAPETKTARPDKGLRATDKKLTALSLVLLGGLGLGLVLVPSWRGAALANFGALKMAKLELAGFPLNSWEDGLTGADFDPERAILLQAIASDADQPTANYRLGRIALQDGRYEEAARYLLTAHTKDPHHYGIQKQLGYTYVWLGNFNAAFALLQDYPEAETEMVSYSNWWRQRGDPTLAANADQMYEYLRTQK